MRLALFGGTFDPIHNAHLTVAREAAAQFHLDQVWFVPAAHPPHKSDHTGATYEDRYRMTELACQADPRFVASRLEAGAAKSYSVDTVERVAFHGRAALLHHRRRRFRRNHQLAPLAGFGPADRVYRRDAARPSLRRAPRSASTSPGNRRAARIFVRNKAKTRAWRDSPGIARTRRPITLRNAACINPPRAGWKRALFKLILQLAFTNP